MIPKSEACAILKALIIACSRYNVFNDSIEIRTDCEQDKIPRKMSNISTPTSRRLRKVNSRGAKNFPFSYFDFTLIHCSQVMKNIKASHKIRTDVIDFECESLYRSHCRTP